MDDTTAIEGALAKVAEEGGVLYFPPGVYKVTRTLRITEDGIKVGGACKRSTRLQFTPSALYPTCFLLESADGSPLQHVVLEDLEIRAASDTSFVKYAIDMHGARHCVVRNVIVQGWEDTTRASVALRIRGWDNLMFQNLSLTANYPVVIAKNDDGTLGTIGSGYLDSTKDLDHANFLRCNLVADNAGKIAVKVEDAVVYRNVTFDGIAFVHGGFYNVDTTAPRRRSTNLAFYNIRCEGFAETTGSVVGVYAIDIRRHGAGKLRNVLVQNMLLAEGRDDAYGTTAANWNGARFEGVWHKELVGVTYSGQATPLTYDGAAPLITGGQWSEGDNGKLKPAVEAQWDQVGVPRPRSWWTFASASGNHTDQQDAAVSGLADRTMFANGTPLYQQLVENWSSYHVKYTEADGQRFGLNSGLTDFNPNDRSAAWMGWFKFPSAWVPGGDRVLINLGSCAQAGAAGPNVYITPDGTLDIYAGSTVVSGTRSYLGKDVAILAVYNRTAGTWVVYVAMDNSDVIETITGTYAAAVGSVNQKGFGAEAGFFNSAAYQDFGAMWFNADAESLGAQTLRAMNWGT